MSENQEVRCSHHKSALGEISSKDALLLKNILLEILNNSNKEKFNDFIDNFDTETFSNEIRAQAIVLLEKAYNKKDGTSESSNKWNAFKENFEFLEILL